MFSWESKIVSLAGKIGFPISPAIHWGPARDTPYSVRMTALSIELSHPARHPDAAVVALKGVLYANTVGDVQRTFDAVMASGKRRLVFDLRGAQHVSSGGWGFFLSISKKTMAANGELRLSGMQPEVYDAFELLGYHKTLPLFPTIDEALAEGLAAGPA